MKVVHKDKKYNITLYVFLCHFLDGFPECIEVMDWKWIDFSELNKYNFTPADIKVIEEIHKIKGRNEQVFPF